MSFSASHRDYGMIVNSKAHQFCLPMCVGLIEDVLQVSLNCGH
jgi:hypothetical protein